MDQWKLEFAAHEAELGKRMFFAIDEADGSADRHGDRVAVHGPTGAA